MTYEYACKEIADELNKRGMVIKNLKTGMIVKTWEDVYNYDSKGGLVHIYQWYAMLFPDRVGENGELNPKKESE